MSPSPIDFAAQGFQRRVNMHTLPTAALDFEGPIEKLPATLKVPPVIRVNGEPKESIPEMIQRAKDQWTAGTRMPQGGKVLIDVPPGGYDAFELRTEERADRDTIGMNWLGASTLILTGSGAENSSKGSKIRSSGDASGATVKLNVLPSYRDRLNPTADPSWEGRVHMRGFYLWSSKLATLQTIGSSRVAPYRDVRLVDCLLRDHLDPSLHPKWGAILAQTAFAMINCDVHLERVYEHVVYDQNACGDAEYLGNVCTASGSNFLQSTSRSKDGPIYARNDVLFADNRITGYPLWPNRASNALTIGGSNRNWQIRRNWIWTLKGPAHAAGEAFGCVVAWDDTQQPSPAGSPPVNGKIAMHNNIMGGMDQNRDNVDIQNAEHFECKDNFLWGEALNIQEGLWGYDINKNNTEAIRDWIRQQPGIPNSILRMGSDFRKGRNNATRVPLAGFREMTA